MGAAVPGVLFPVNRTGTLVAHLHRRHLRAKSLPTACEARDQSDPVRCAQDAQSAGWPGVLSL